MAVCHNAASLPDPFRVRQAPVRSEFSSKSLRIAQFVGQSGRGGLRAVHRLAPLRPVVVLVEALSATHADREDVCALDVVTAQFQVVETYRPYCPAQELSMSE